MKLSGNCWVTFIIYFITSSHLEASSTLNNTKHRFIRNIFKRQNTEGSDINKHGRYIGTQNDECSDIFEMGEEDDPIDIEVDNDIMKIPGTTCHWEIFGAEMCHPMINCKKFSLDNNDSPDGTCTEEYLEATDGVSGYETFCGNNSPKNIMTGPGRRDMYLTFQAAKKLKSSKRKLRCQVLCVNIKENHHYIGENFQPDVDQVNCNCGRKPNENRIVGGVEAKQGEFPWIAAFVTANTRSPYCGGTLINDQFILTAAHCFKGPYIDKTKFQVLLNAHDLGITSSGDEEQINISPEQLEKVDKEQNIIRFDVEKYFIHPLYVKQTNDYDVALVKLAESIDFQIYSKDPYIAPICLPNPIEENIITNNRMIDGSQVIVAGWGLNAPNASATMPTLQKVDVKIFNDTVCSDYFNPRFTERMMCAGQLGGNKDSCKGDSGGPLMTEKQAQVWQSVGIVSWGEGCGKANKPGVYVRVHEVVQWIRYVSNMEGAVWCAD